MKATTEALTCPPLFGTPRSPDRPTLGGQVAAVAAKLRKPLMPHQRHIVDVALELDPATGLPAYSEVVVIGPRQATGKALDVATPLWTQRGWVPMGEIRPADRVPHPDGRMTEVVFASEVMHDHVCYRVTTSDGRTVVADAGHLWRVRDTYSGGSRPWRTMTTAEIVATGLRNRGTPGGWRFRLPIQHAVKTPDVPLPLDPYLLGLWLGDGTTARAEVTSADPEVFAAFEAAGFAPSYTYPTGTAVTRGLRGLVTVLRALGVLGDKHVPESYLTAGHDQRLALLQGLMDTDGCITENHGNSPRCEFTSTKRLLADAVLFLARSLGWRASISEGRATLNGRDRGPKWRVGFTATTDDPSPFRLPRKASAIRAARARTVTRTAVSIVAVEPVESRPVRCIKVAAPDGLFLAGRDLVATHNTELLLPVMTHRCVGFGPSLTDWIRRELGVDPPEPGAQTVVYTAQTADDARKKWRDVHVARLEKSAYRRQFTPRLRLNAEAMMWRDGSRWSPASTTGKTGGTGDTIDLPVIDEAWSRPDNRTELGLRPASMTRPWRQMWVLSMIPGLSRAAPGTWAYLERKRQVGRARVQADIRQGTAFFDWSAAPGLDPADPQTWWSCMPGLGRTVPERAVREDFESGMPLVDFCAEYLGWAPTVSAQRWRLWREETWTGLADRDSQPAGPVSLCLDMDPEGSAAWICAAGRRADGDWHVEVLEPGQLIAVGTTGADWAERRLLDIVDNPLNDVCAVVIDPRGGAAPSIATLRPKLAARGIPLITPTPIEVAQACRRLYDATGEQADPDAVVELPPTRVRHLDQPELNRACAAARKLESPTYGTFVWARVGNAISISALYGVTLAMQGHVVVAPDDYDLLDSVGGYDGECLECGASPAPGTERIEHDPECPVLLGV